MKYERRIEYATNQTAKRLFEIMAQKETNLAFNPDVTDSNTFLQLIDRIGSEVCVIKTHIDILTDFTPAVIETLVDLQRKHGFLIFEDRKFADIGHIVQLQYTQGLYHIVDWADLVTVHAVPGPGIIEGLRDAGGWKGRGLLLLAEMSSGGNLATGEYTHTAVQWAQEYKDSIAGFIGMKRLSEDPGFVTFTPGVNLYTTSDTLKQTYQTPSQAIQNGSDVLIVGRGIHEAKDPMQAAKEYRKAGWEAYRSRE